MKVAKGPAPGPFAHPRHMFIAKNRIITRRGPKNELTCLICSGLVIAITIWT